MSVARSLAVAAALAMSVAGLATAKEVARPPVFPALSPALPHSRVDLVRPVHVPLAPGQVLELRGEVRTSFDGVTYDAAARYDEAGERLGGLVALEDTGLRLVRRERGYVELESTGAHAPICAALALTSPCLVPRTVSLAHDRLLTEADFAATLSGGLELGVPAPPAPPSPVVSWLLEKLVALGIMLGLAGLVLAWRKRRKEPLVRVRAAAKDARVAVRGEPDAATLLAQIDDLVSGARALVSAERAASRRLAKERERPTRAAMGDFGIKASAEVDRLERERDRARRGLEETVEALRVMALRGASAAPSIEETERTLAKLGDDLELRREAAAEAAASLRP